MAWSKFDPTQAPRGETATPAALRRARILRYGWWITTAMTALGFALMAYWATHNR